MKNLVLPGVLAGALLSQATGCIIFTDDDGTTFEAASITAQWSFKNEATGAATGCPAGFDTVALHSFAIDGAGNKVGPEVIDLFDCGAGAGVSDPLAPDVYNSFIEVTDTNNTNLYAQSLSAIVDVIDADKTFTSTILNDGGYFSFGWDLVGAQSGSSLRCADVGGLDGIEAISTVSGGTGAVTDQFDCEDHFGVTGGLLAGSYTVSVDAFNRDGAALGAAPALTSKAILDRNQVTQLGNIMIPIDGH